MGGSSSKDPEENCDDEESRQYEAKIEEHISDLQTEVSQMKPLITENVKQQMSQEASTVVLRYGEMRNAETMSEDIQGILMEEMKTKNKDAAQFVMEAAKGIVAQYKCKDGRKKLSRTKQFKKIMKCGHVTAGMEIQYKITIVEEKVGALARVGGGSTDTVFILGYKFIQHVLDIDPASLPDDEKLQELTL